MFLFWLAYLFCIHVFALFLSKIPDIATIQILEELISSTQISYWRYFHIIFVGKLLTNTIPTSLQGILFLIIPHITKTESNNFFIIHCFALLLPLKPSGQLPQICFYQLLPIIRHEELERNRTWPNLYTLQYDCIGIDQRAYIFWLLSQTLACVQTPPSPQKKSGRETSVVNRVPVYICINYFCCCFSSDSWKGVDRTIRH